jgi:menaquinone-9 beta-reductase
MQLIPRKTEVFVIGGGPAGLSAAIAACHAGLDVTVADGTCTPIDKACGEGNRVRVTAEVQELEVMASIQVGNLVRRMHLFGHKRSR